MPPDEIARLNAGEGQYQDVPLLSPGPQIMADLEHVLELPVPSVPDCETTTFGVYTRYKRGVAVSLVGQKLHLVPESFWTLPHLRLLLIHRKQEQETPP